MASGSEVKRLQVIYEVNDKQFVDGMNRMRSASEGANAAITSATRDTEQKTKDLGDTATSTAAKVSAANDNIAASAERSSQVVRRSIQQTIDANIKQAQSSKSAEESWRSMSAEMNRLRAQYDPAFASAMQYEQAVEAINQAHTRGAITTKQQEVALQRLSASYTSTGSIMGLFRRNMQNMSYQIQDMAVQFAMGTNAAIVMGQQLPQLLGGFGAMGAALGAVVAIAAPAFAVLSRMGSLGGDLEDRMKALSEAVDEYASAVEAANIPTEELIEKYGRASEQARIFLAELQGIAEYKGIQTLNQQLTDLSTRFGDLSRVDMDLLDRRISEPASIDYRSQDVRNLITQLDDIRDKMDLADAQIAAIIPKFIALGEAKGALEQADAIEQLRLELVALYGDFADGANEIPPAVRELYEELVLSGEEVADMVGNLDEAERSADSVAAAAARIDLSGAVADAQDLVGALASAATAMSRLEQRQAMASARQELRSRFRGDAVGLAGAEAGLEFDSLLPDIALTPQQRADFEERKQLYIEEAEAIAMSEAELQKWTAAQRESSRSSSKKRSGRGRSESPFFEGVENQAIELQREIELIGKGASEVARARAEWALLDEAKKRGIPVSAELRAKIAEEAGEVGRLTQALEDGRIAHERFEEAIDMIAGTMAEVLMGAQSLREGLASIFKNIAIDIINSGIQNAIRQAFGFGTGFSWSNLWRGDALSGALRGAGLPAIRSYEGGGHTGFGPRSGGADGRGGRLAVVHPNETILDHSQGQSLLGNMTFAPTINVGGNVTQDDIARIHEALEFERRNFNKNVLKATTDNTQRYG